MSSNGESVISGPAGLGIGDMVAEWEIRLKDGLHKVRLEHGSTSGKRVITVDGKEIYRKSWMFALVGTEQFYISSRPAEITISSKGGMMLEYTLNVDGKSLKKFIESQIKNTRVWLPEINGRGHRVVLDIEKMDLHVDGVQLETSGEFTDTGTETHFRLDTHPAFIRSTSSGDKHKGLMYTLVIGNTELEPISEVVT